MYILNIDTQNYPLYNLKLVVETFKHSNSQSKFTKTNHRTDITQNNLSKRNQHRKKNSIPILMLSDFI